MSLSTLCRTSAARVARVAVAQRGRVVAAAAARTSSTLVSARAVAVAGPSSNAVAAAATAGARRHATNWVRNFLQRDPKKGERAQEIDEKELGRIPVPTPEGTPLRNPSSLRPPYAPNRFTVPGEENKDTAQRQAELRLGAGVEKMDLHPYCRIDEFGNPIPKHLMPAFPKSRKLVQEYDVVVIGAGAGGMAVAQKLGGAGMTDVDLKLNDEGNMHLPMNERRFDYKTLIIEPSANHYYQPMWTLVGGGKREMEDSIKSNWDYVFAMRHKVHMLQTSVVELLPHENAVITADGRKVQYKQLVIASGLEVKVDKVKGLRDALGRAGVSSNYVYPYAERTWDFIRFFPGGDAIFTQPAGAIKCAGAPQKIMYLAEDFWRRHVGRNLCNIKFVSGGPKLFGVPHYEKTLHEQCREKGIKDLQFGLNLVEVKPREKEAVFERVLPSAAGSVGDRVTMPYTFLHVTPPQGPYDFIASSVLADANGWVDVNKETLQHNRFPNVFAVGDCSSAPTSKTAAAAGAQATVVVENLIRFRERRAVSAKYDGYTACPFTLGNDKAMFAEFDYSGTPRETLPVDGSKPSKMLYYVKEEVFPHVYWDRLLEGIHDMDTYRRWFHPLRAALGISAPAQAQAQAQAQAPAK